MVLSSDDQTAPLAGNGQAHCSFYYSLGSHQMPSILVTLRLRKEGKEGKKEGWRKRGRKGRKERRKEIICQKQNKKLFEEELGVVTGV